jgi:hypothetical protein
MVGWLAVQFTATVDLDVLEHDAENTGESLWHIASEWRTQQSRFTRTTLRVS